MDRAVGGAEERRGHMKQCRGRWCRRSRRQTWENFSNLLDVEPEPRKALGLQKFEVNILLFILYITCDGTKHLEQCSLKVLEPEGSPSLCLLKLLGEKGCTVVELSDFLQAMERTEVLQLLSPPGTLKLRRKCVHVLISMQVPYVDLEHQGTYWCRVYNDRDSQDSKKVEIIIAKDKVALLIGNMNYWEHPKLKAPLVDVYELTNLLRQLDFKVVSLLDLTEYEMRNAVDEFLLLLDKGVYGLLYYAGHGYENFGNSFMVPVDAPNPYRSENCLCVQNILKLMQEKETGLNVFLLDMCRKRNDYDDTIPILDALKVTANIVFGYATCQGAEAFEIQHSGLANGIFMKFLKDRLLEEKKITVLLDEVAEELPESMCLKFQCGVQIQLGFAAEFSNVMIIYTSILHKPPDILVCDAYVTDFPLEHLVFTVCLSYQYSGLEDTIEEKQEVNAGKPLIAKLDIHRGLGRKACFQTCIMCNGPFQSSTSTSAGAGHYHSSQDSFCGVYHSRLSNSSNVLPSDGCPCSRTADTFISSHHAHHHPCQLGRSNVPVETTDEMPFNFSDGLRISEK
ncbi:mucosa-associated lymphoid tissue lymphoma translocation protein 1 [Camelus ferus]|nr:mucosa-associated lymphoid tissue lymphoma translocation protein 1 [Camelus ferus]